MLRGVWITRLPSERIMEFVSGHGEIWSAQLLHAYLKTRGHSSTWLDARKVLVVEPNSNTVAIDWPLSQEKLNAWQMDQADTDFLIITGYVASTHDGVATTLKRNGSDLSASIFAALLGADSVTIWTDVDGVFSADPRRVNDAVIIPELSYQEAAELAYFGAKVIHPNTMCAGDRKRHHRLDQKQFQARSSGHENLRVLTVRRADQRIRGGRRHGPHKRRRHRDDRHPRRGP